MSDWSTSTVTHCQPKLPTKSTKKRCYFPNSRKQERERERAAEERAEKREPTKRSLREQTSRENEASHQEENLESEELLATAEHSSILVLYFVLVIPINIPYLAFSVTLPS